MNMRRWMGALLLMGGLLIASMGAYGQQTKDKDGKDQKKAEATQAPPMGGGTKLTLKAFEPKAKTFWQEMATKTKQEMKVMQMQVTQTQDQTFWVSWTPEDKKGNDLVVKQKITDLKMDIEIGGNKISYNSTDMNQQSNPLTDFFKALKGAEFTILVNDDAKSPQFMTVSKVEGREAFIQKLSAANAQLEPLLKTILSEDALKQMTEPAFGVIPPKGEVPADKKWTKESKLDMGPIGAYDTTYNYTYTGKTGSMANIDVVANLKYSAPKDTKKEGLPFKILKADLTGKGNGVVHFDEDKGRVNDSKLDMKVEGKLTIEIGGMTTEVELNQTQVAELKTFDTDPNAKK
jgi:Family of unknown function (DUF6263)